MPEINVLLLNPNWRELNQVGRMGTIFPSLPLELVYIQEGLRLHNIKNSLADLWASNQSVESISSQISNADILILTTAPTYSFWRDGTTGIDFPLSIIRKIRAINNKSKLILIGPQGTISPKIFMDSGADFLVKGEPDLAVPSLVFNILKGKSQNMPGVCYKKGNGSWHIDPNYAVVEKMDDLPNIPYDKLDLKKYVFSGFGLKQNKAITALYESSRGCPYNCIFCFREGFRGKYRTKSPLKIKNEASLLKKAGVTKIYLIDEIFGVKHIEEICSVFKAYGLKWGCETRSEVLNPKIIDLIADSGCEDINLGLESGDKNILKILGKESINLDNLRNNISLMSKKGIHTHLYMIVGSPQETKKSLQNTLDYLSSLPLEHISITAGIMIPYPQTKLWQIGLAGGFGLKEWKNMDDFRGIVGNKFDRLSIEKEFILFSLKIKNMQTKSHLKRNKILFFRMLLEKAAIAGFSIMPKHLFYKQKIFNLLRKLYYKIYF